MLLNNFHCDFNYTIILPHRSDNLMLSFWARALQRDVFPVPGGPCVKKKIYSTQSIMKFLAFNSTLKQFPKFFIRLIITHTIVQDFSGLENPKFLTVTNPAKPCHLEQKLSKFLPTNFFEVDGKFLALRRNISPAIFALTNGYFLEHQL